MDQLREINNVHADDEKGLCGEAAWGEAVEEVRTLMMMVWSSFKE